MVFVRFGGKKTNSWEIAAPRAPLAMCVLLFEVFRNRGYQYYWYPFPSAACWCVYDCVYAFITGNLFTSSDWCHMSSLLGFPWCILPLPYIVYTNTVSVSCPAAVYRYSTVRLWTSEIHAHVTAMKITKEHLHANCDIYVQRVSIYIRVVTRFVITTNYK